MRGTPLIVCHSTPFTGIIPAYAGNTHRMNQRAARHGDHPRVCGEHTMASSGVRACSGSSPRMRGTLVQSVDAERGDGIIPAYAGNTSPSIRQAATRRDHPRVCGEHIEYKVEGANSQGSSPRMRGTRFRQLEVRRRPGIIPAYAGNTSLLTRFSSMSQDHPRVCGEHFIEQTDAPRIVGSSPRMRGTPFSDCGRGTGRGIIPAYAGNTDLLWSASGLFRDHPRVCGEHLMPQFFHASCAGSSPRMRGTPVLRSFRGLRMGIIPAYAGNTGRQSCRPFWRRDHPRVCGEHS